MRYVDLERRLIALVALSQYTHAQELALNDSLHAHVSLSCAE